MKRARIPCSVFGATTKPLFGRVGNFLHRARKNYYFNFNTMKLNKKILNKPGTQVGDCDQLPL